MKNAANIAKQAEQAVEAYDAYVFSPVGHPFDGDKADTLAAVAWVACEDAAKAYRRINKNDASYWKAKALEMRAIAS